MTSTTDAEVGSGFPHEVRLGLVLYGGVSLAIYMNGTTNELHRAVRGRGVYFLLKHLLDADITVDVASGASAGGINGIFLSFALANGLEFGTCADLWRRDGDLGSLLRELGQETLPSVLDSEHYRKVLENGFRVMWAHEPLTRELECPSPTRELDLFVTGTSFYGRYAQAVDSTGRVIETKQHRTVFLLKHRHRIRSKCQLDPRRDAYGRWPEGFEERNDSSLDRLDEPENPPEPDAGFLALAKLAQITSCFPGAFAAVGVNATNQGDGEPESEADQRLKIWGQLPVGEHYFVDGGVLDNKPFTTTLDAIFHRPADRRVCRHLLYLEPDPERFAKEKEGQRDEDGKLAVPSFVSSVLDSMTRLPSYESIADDLARIAEHNASIQRFDELVEGLGKNGDARPSRSAYLTARLLAIGQRVNAKLAEALGSVEFVPAGTKTGEPQRLPSDAIGALLERLSTVIHDFPPGELPELLKRLDVDFYIRRLLALTYVLEERSDEQNEGSGDARELWRHVNEELQRLEILRSAMERVVVPPWIWQGGAGFDERVEAVDAGELWDEIERRALALLAAGEPEHGAPSSRYPAPRSTSADRRRMLRDKELDRARFSEEIDARVRKLEKLDAAELPKERPLRTLLEESDERVRSFVAASPCDVKEFLSTFEAEEDALRFPLEFAARVRQRDQISVVRLSPFDAQCGFSKLAFEDKICGETFGHFGAFLKKSWRSNDLLWGRLDGISRLVETLLLHTPFGKEQASRRRSKLLEALGRSDEERRASLGRLFPRLEQRIQTRGKRGEPDPLSHLLEVLAAEQAPAPSALADLLCSTAQLDVLSEDLPKVIADAAEEQLEWGQLKVGGKAGPTRADLEKASKRTFSAEAWEFRPRPGALDRNLLELATRLFAEQSLAAMSAGELGQYFKEKYAVGRESALLTMPVTVLADLGARGVVLAETALVSGGRIGESVRENGLYRLILRWPLRVIAALAAFLRRSPQYRISFVVGSLLYAALAIIANVLLAGALYERDGFGRTVAIWAFALLPLAALVLAWIVWRSPLWKRLLVVAVLGVAAFTLWRNFDALLGYARGKCETACKEIPQRGSTTAGRSR